MSRLGGLLGQYGPLIRNPHIVRLVLAGFISDIGSRISYFALLRKVYIISGGSITDLGFLAIVEMVPGMLLGPVAGLLVDRFPRRRVMLLCDLANALIILSLVFVDHLAYIYVVAGLSSIVTVFRFPAQRALEPNLVEKTQIVLLNSFNASVRGVIQVVGAAIGGMTVGFLGAQVAFVVDSITFALSALLVLGIRVTETHVVLTHPEHSGTRAALRRQWNDFRQGVAVLGDNMKVRLVFLTQIFLTFAMAMQGTLIYYFLRETLELGDRAEQFWGYLLSGLGVGGIVGSFFVGLVVQRYPNRIRLYLNVLLVDAIALAAFLFSRDLTLSLAIFSTLGLIGAAHQIIINSVLQEEVEDAKRGRVFSLMGMFNGPVSAFSIFVGTVGAGLVTAQTVLLLAAACEACIALGLRFTASYRVVDRAAAAARPEAPA